ncbi:phosphopentomutase [Aureibacillus halotolerans]|uniref:Phosphopentomutase n=1 Tax=Aureibacillus halotolerans TaxID=1508390 RepID=A0A4V3D5W2_9BACI|nr:phosphopentomutase [Aureibacillus halotolerans]TDQ41607.1 phosphopentomutase [Aureibacillus halotolerans]
MNQLFQRAVVVVLDSVGIGAADDAKEFGDLGAHTLGHLADVTSDGLHVPALEAMGLGHLAELNGVAKVDEPSAFHTIMKPVANGKDTMTGHWELMGVVVDEPFQTYPDGFPEEVIKRIEQESGRRVIGNVPASGTEIIKQFGPQQLKDGSLIVYTSADSVLQIAAHEEVIPLEELYEICERIRSWTKEPPHLVGRIIARPYRGKSGQFTRTSNRRDYALKPYGPTTLTTLKEHSLAVIGIGKIADIYDGEGITESIKTKSNDDGVDQLLTVLKREPEQGLVFVNLVDFDALYGHRRDPKGYKEALEAFDKRLPEITAALNESDVLIITADHGNDPTATGTDHTRENVPLLLYSPRWKEGKALPERQSFCDLGAFISENFQVPKGKHGTSFFGELGESNDG